MLSNIKNVFGYDKMRYRRLGKNESCLTTLFAPGNLLMAGRKIAILPLDDGQGVSLPQWLRKRSRGAGEK